MWSRQLWIRNDFRQGNYGALHLGEGKTYSLGLWESRKFEVHKILGGAALPALR